MMQWKTVLAAGLLTTMAACTTTPDPVEVSEVLEVDATVIAVDADARIMLLQGPRGNRIVSEVGPEVRNLAQIQAGDTLAVRYYTGYMLMMAYPGAAGADAELMAGRAEPGERPGAMAGTSRRETVEILSVSEEGDKASFRDSAGRIQSVPVLDPDVQAFAKRLKQGDLVDIRYTEAFTISVEETKSDES